MFKQLKRIVYPVADLASAKSWYTDILGKQPLFDAPFAAIYVLGDCSLSLALAPKASQPDAHPTAQPATQPTAQPATAPPAAAEPAMAVYWEVDDIEAAVDLLLRKGARLHTPVASALNIRTARVVDPFGNVLGLTDQGMADARKSVAEKPSDTALTVAFCRALAALEERRELRGPDHLASIFLGPEARTLLATPQNRRWAVDNLVTSKLYGYFIARTAYLDALFAESLRQGLPQVVFLGAGYDTRAIRHQVWLGKTRVFELDIATTQQRKRELLRDAGLSVPETLITVPINFEKEDLAAALIQAGYDPSKAALFIWEGVLYYLTKPAIEAVLHFFQLHVATGSRLAFDCLREPTQSVNPAEPFRFWMTTGQMAAFLASYGLQPVETVVPADMAARFLTLADGSAGEGCLDSFYFMLAEKTAPEKRATQTDQVAGLRILPAKPAEYADLWQMQRIAYATETLLYDEPIPPMTQSKDDAIADCERSQVLNASLDGQTVGSIRYRVQDGTCHIAKLMVLPEYRNRGIGSALLRAVETAAPGLRCELFTGTRSLGNIRLYEQNGYRLFKTDPDRQLVYLEKLAAQPVAPWLCGTIIHG